MPLFSGVDYMSSKLLVLAVSLLYREIETRHKREREQAVGVDIYEGVSLAVYIHTETRSACNLFRTYGTLCMLK